MAASRGLGGEAAGKGGLADLQDMLGERRRKRSSKADAFIANLQMQRTR